MDSAKRIIDLNNALRNMPECKLTQKIKKLDNSLDIFKGNYAELRKLLTTKYNMPEAISLCDVKDIHLIYARQREVGRLLHNFVAAAKSQVDNTQTLKNKLNKKEKQFTEYKKEVKNRFGSNPLVQFVHKLREYCLHYESPPVFSTMSLELEPSGGEIRLMLNKSELEQWNSWKQDAKKFLAEQKTSIDLVEVVDGYYSQVMDFHNWFGEHVRKIHAEEFAKVDAKRREIAELVIPNIIQGELVNPTRDASAPDKSFTAILAPQEWEQVQNYHVKSPERYQALITFLEKWMLLDENTKQQIKQIYY